MTAISQLTVYDFLRANTAVFKRLGISAKRMPEHRCRYTGHPKTLSKMWVQSVGYWGGGMSWETPRPLFNAKHPEKATIKAKGSSFGNFKSMWHLYTPQEFQHNHGKAPWLLAELSYAAIEQEYERADARIELGIAALKAWKRSELNHCPLATHIGLLPVEILLWARVFHAFLTSYGLDLTLWRDMPLDDQRSFWKHEVRATAESRLFYSPATFLRRPAVLHYEDDDDISHGRFALAS